MTDWKSPCVLCGYNGSGFYQPETHACMKHGTERGALLAEISSLKAEVRTLKQRLDCTYGDTPGLIHCPPDQPCAMHEAERLREAREARLKALGYDLDTRAPDSVGALIGLRNMKEEP